MFKPKLFPNLRLPVIAAPMFLVSGPELVIESCQAGIVGTFPALNQRTREGFREWIHEIRSKTQAPFGVNLIVHKSNPRLEADLAICIEEKVPLIITSLGAVPELVAKVHSYGGLVFHDVTTLRHARKAAEAGVDGLIAVTGGAGGHAGTTNPFALLCQIRSFFKGSIALAGAISTGSDVCAAIAMGADFAYMGTRFIATTESTASADYKQMLVSSEADDIVYTAAVSGIPANFMKPSLEKAGLLVDGKTVADPGHKINMNDEAKAWKSIWSAGHGVSAIHDVLPTAKLIARLEKEYEAARLRL